MILKGMSGASTGATMGQQWTIMGQQWGNNGATMGNNVQQWATIGNNGQQWTTMFTLDSNRQQSVVLH